MLKRILSLSWVVILFVQMCIFANAQTATPNPLQTEVDEAEARAKIAKAKKEELEAKFPAPDADALKGSTDVKGELIESKIQAYKAMEDISGKIAADPRMAGISGLYVFREADYAKVVSYKKLIQQLDVINGEYTKCAPGGVAIAGAPVGVLASIFLNWLPLLKTETTIVGTDVVIEDEAVWASLANSLSSKGISLSNPYVSNFDFSVVAGGGASNLINKLLAAENSLLKPACTNNGYKLKPQVDAAFKKLKKDIALEVDAPTNEIKKTTTTTTPPPPKTVVEETIEITPATSPSSNSVTWFDYLVTEQVITNMQTNNIFWIKIKNTKSSGNMRIKSNPLIDIFRGGNSVKFSGGSISYYYILDNDGKIKLSGVVYGYIRYKKSSQI